ncbi:MAG: hypothetical protein P8127_12340 [Acidobacteriota bacterium]
MNQSVELRPRGSGLENLGSVLAALVDSESGHRQLRVNRHDDVLWFHRESFGELLLRVLLGWVSDAVVEDSVAALATISAAAAVLETLGEAAEASGFRLADFLEILTTADDIAKPNG